MENVEECRGRLLLDFFNHGVDLSSGIVFLWSRMICYFEYGGLV